MPNERGVCYKLPHEYVDETDGAQRQEHRDIMVYGMYTDCSALGEEAVSCDEVGYLEGKEVWMRAGLPV